MRQGAGFRQQREPQQPQDEENLQSQRAEGQARERRKGGIRLRLRPLPEKRQSGARVSFYFL